MNALRLRIWLLSSIIAGVFGCDGSVRTHEVMVRDSAGTQIAEFDWSAVQPSWRVDSIAQWSIGDPNATGSPIELHDVGDAMTLRNGSVAFVERSTQQVLWVDSAGQLVRRAGGRGDGPDQFQGISRIFDGGDGGIIIFDSTRKRYVRLGREGELLEEGVVPTAVGAIVAAHRTPAGEWYLLSNGPLEETGVARNGAGEEVGVVRRPRAALLRASLDGSQSVDSLTTMLGSESAAGPASMGILAFAATGLMAGSADGVWVGDTKRPEVSMWTAVGPRWVVRWSNAGSGAVDESVREALWTDLGARASAQELAGARAVLPFSEEVPAFEGLVVGEDERIWIGGYASYMAEMFQSPQREQEWVVLDLEDGTAGKVVAPPGLRVLRAGPDYVVGIHRDELGVESVRRYRLIPL